MEKLLAGVLLILAGFVGFMSSSFVAPGGEFLDEYPIEDSWGASGTHNNTLTDENGYLVISDVNEESGVFKSDKIDKDVFIEIDRIIFETDQIKPNQDQVIDLEVRAYDNSIIAESETFEIRENGVSSVDISSLANEQFTSYDFIVNLETTSNDSPRLISLALQGQTFSLDDPLSQGFLYLMLFLGFMLMVRSFI